MSWFNWDSVACPHASRGHGFGAHIQQLNLNNLNVSLIMVITEPINGDLKFSIGCATPTHKQKEAALRPAWDWAILVSSWGHAVFPADRRFTLYRHFIRSKITNTWVGLFFGFRTTSTAHGTDSTGSWKYPFFYPWFMLTRFTAVPNPTIGFRPQSCLQRSRVTSGSCSRKTQKGLLLLCPVCHKG